VQVPYCKVITHPLGLGLGQGGQLGVRSDSILHRILVEHLASFLRTYSTMTPRRLRRGVDATLHLDDSSPGQPVCHVREPLRLRLIPYPRSRREQHPHDGRLTPDGGDLQRCRSIAVSARLVHVSTLAKQHLHNVVCPSPAAAYSGVYPSSVMATFVFAPCASSFSTTFACPS